MEIHVFWVVSHGNILMSLYRHLVAWKNRTVCLKSCTSFVVIKWFGRWIKCPSLFCDVSEFLSLLLLLPLMLLLLWSISQLSPCVSVPCLSIPGHPGKISYWSLNKMSLFGLWCKWVPVSIITATTDAAAAMVYLPAFSMCFCPLLVYSRPPRQNFLSRLSI